MKRPLLFLLADKDMREACKGCFVDRKDWARAFGCRKIDIGDRDLVVPPGLKDPGLFARGHEIAREYYKTHDHLVVLLDSAWHGSPGSRSIESELRERLGRNGWSHDHFQIIAIEPELEAWAWSDRNALFQALSTELDRNRRASLRSSLQAAEGNEVQAGDRKAELAELRERLRIPASSAQFRRFATIARIDRCTDPAFARLRESLRRWFPPGISNGNGPRRGDR